MTEQLELATEKVLETLQGTNDDDKKQSIKYIDSFIKHTTPQGKIFWLKIRSSIERMLENKNASKTIIIQNTGKRDV